MAGFAHRDVSAGRDVRPRGDEHPERRQIGLTDLQLLEGPVVRSTVDDDDLVWHLGLRRLMPSSSSANPSRSFRTVTISETGT